jgi:hypothetical protein
LIDALSGGDRRSVGRSRTVASWLKRDIALVPEAILLMSHDDPVVAMRAADALEKATRQHPGILWPHRAALLKLMRRSKQPEIVWHLAQLLPRLELTDQQAESVVIWLERVFTDADSRIARAESLEGLMLLVLKHPALLPVAARTLRAATRSLIPAVAARARQLAKEHKTFLK